MDTINPDMVLDFWFSDSDALAPQLDSRMVRWLDNDDATDQEIRCRFEDAVEAALKGQLDDWAATPRGRLALILLLDTFPRRIWRNQPEAYRGDRAALKLCTEGASRGEFKSLDAVSRLFFFMPLQHSESLKIQEKAVLIYKALAKKCSATQQETFDTYVQLAELYRDVIETHGRFPHRDEILGRMKTPAPAPVPVLEEAEPAMA